MENNSCTNVCRFCLETSDRNFETIGDVTFANLDFLWLKVNLSISEEPVMCGECAKNIRNCSDFKTKCLDIENYIMSCVKEKDSIKVDLQEVYKCKMSAENTVNVPEDHIVCRLCLELVGNDSAVFLSNSSDIMQKLEQYFPELDLTCAEDPVICASCQVRLQYYFSFINSCLTIEEKIVEYCKVEGTNGMGQINLNSIIRFISKDFLKLNFEVDAVKIEETYNEVNENASNNVEMKKEEVLDMELDIKEDSSAQESELTDNRIQRHPSPPQSDGVPQLTNAKSASHTCGYTQKTDTEVTMYKCDLCNYETKKKSHMKGHMLIHKTPSEITMHKCHLCDYETKWKSGLKDHMLIHKTLSEVTIYKCDLCDYKAKRNSNLKRHMLTHTEIIKCEVCAYETKNKNHLQQHMLKHRDILKTEMHESEICLFETKWSSTFPRDTPDVVTRGAVYKCDHCDYKAKRKSDLRSHMLIHKTHSEITMYKCEACTYETRHERCLRQHTLTHMDESEIEMHKCEVCPFKTKWSGSFHEHLRSHRSTAEVVTRGTRYKCDMCEYEAKRKSHLMTHMLIHKTHSEIATFKCDLCDYEAKRKADLTRHTLTHKTHSEIIVYKCHLCDYEGKQKAFLKRHMLVHKTASEIIMSKCETCAYETKHKDYLHKHRLIHMNVSEIEMHKCEVCPFETKWNSSFRTHQLSHRNAPDVRSNMRDV